MDQWLSQLLVILLAFPPVMLGQQQQSPPAAAAPAQAQPMAKLPVVQNLKVITLAGEGEMNDLERHTVVPIVVQVLDENDRPVEGAEVVFRFPVRGAGGSFANQKTSQTTRTNAVGQAAATGWTANSEVGAFQVHATATFGNQMGEKVISMSNVPRIVEDLRKKHKDQKWWTTRKFKIAVIAGGAAAAAVIGIVLATGGGGSTPITISPGSPTIGGPQ